MKKRNEDGSLTEGCCSNKCTNCPYFPRFQKGATELIENVAQNFLNESKSKYQWSIDGKNWYEPDPQKEHEHQIIIGEIFYKYKNN